MLKISEAAAVWKSCDFYNDKVTAGAAAMALCHTLVGTHVESFLRGG